MDRSAPTIIKKYANRRLYHTGTSSYVTLDDLAQMVRAGEDFAVQDARTGEDLTRAVLGQIIFEQESKGAALMPIAFLRQLIRYYGDSMQAVVPAYLETSLAALTNNQEKLREQMGRAMRGDAFGFVEEQVRRNMEMFQEAMRMFLPLRPPGEAPREKGGGREDEIEALRRQLREMQRTIDSLAGAGSGGQAGREEGKG